MRTPVTVGAMIDKGHGVVGWVGARLASSDVLDQRDIGSRCLSRYRSSVSVHPPRVSSQRARCETHNEKKYRQTVSRSSGAGLGTSAAVARTYDKGPESLGLASWAHNLSARMGLEA